MFLGSGWTVGLASEAALKLRESAQAWAEAYPAMEYRHGPIGIAQSGRAVWPFGPLPPGLAEQILATGAHDRRDRPARARWPRSCWRNAIAAAEAAFRGLDQDRPRNLTRSVILPAGGMTR